MPQITSTFISCGKKNFNHLYEYPVFVGVYSYELISGGFSMGGRYSPSDDVDCIDVSTGAVRTTAMAKKNAANWKKIIYFSFENVCLNWHYKYRNGKLTK